MTRDELIKNCGHFNHVLSSSCPECTPQPPKQGKENRLVVSNFHCSEHGEIKPEPVCPKCQNAYQKGWEDILREIEKAVSELEEKCCGGHCDTADGFDKCRDRVLEIIRRKSGMQNK